MKKYLIIVLLISRFSSLLGQSYTFRHYQVENGLSYNSVLCSLQDKKGFMWFGTKDGLNRFDGYTFKIFRNDDEDSTSIGSNFIHSLYEGKDGVLWVGTLRGLYQYNAQTESFSLVKGTRNGDIRDIKVDAQGNLWFIKGLLLSKYNLSTHKIESYSNADFSVTSLCISDGTVWFVTTNGLIWQYHPAQNTFTNNDLFNHSKPAISHWIEKIYATENHQIFIGTSNQGVKLFNTQNKSYEDILNNNPDGTEIYARDFIHYAKDEYWIATESGLFVFNLKTRAFTNLRKQYYNPYSISDNATYTLCKDKEGGIWIGTYFGGVNYFPKQNTAFEKYFYNGSVNSIAGNAIREICSDQLGNLWIGTEDAGLNKRSSKGIFTHFNPTSQNKISHSNIHGLLAVGNELWVGTFEQGLDVLNINTGKLIRHYKVEANPNSLRSNFIETFFKTKSNEVLVGASVGLYRYNPQSDNFTLFSKMPAQYHYNTILEDADGTIWAGTLRDGVYFYNPKTQKSGFYKHQDEHKNSLSNNAINGLFTDSQRNLWICTENGLCKFNPKEQNFTRFGPKNGFPSNVFYKILEDKNQNLWISTSKGLACFNLKTKKISTYAKANGLLSDQFNYNSAYQDAKGKMYFGSVNGLISFVPENFTKNNAMPSVYITGFQVHNEELPINPKNSPLSKSITLTNKITLSHNQSTFSIDFAALGFTAPEMTEYTYKMEGLDKNWTYLKTNRKVYFTELSTGKYTFKVKSSNSSGIWSDDITQLEIEILPPFWASTWAYLLYSLLILAAIVYGIRNYHERINQKNLRKIALLESEKAKEIYQAKIEFFTYVTHEIRTPLTLIKAPLEDIIKKSVDIPSIKESLVTMERNTLRLLDLTNQLLDFRKTETQGFSLNFVKVNISALVQDTFLRFKSAAEVKKIQFEIDLPNSPLFAYADPEALIKILSNLIDNAIKYGRSDVKICLSAQNTNDSFSIEVKSDGNPIPIQMQEKIFEPFFRIEETQNERGTGIGLPLARSLTQLHEGTLSVKTDDMHYNVFTLMLPFHHEQEFKLFQEKQEESNSHESYQETSSDIERPSILLVEDNPEIMEFIANTLATDYLILKASNGQDAMEILKRKSVHLIVSDVMMPIMDGFELCKTVKNNLDYTHIPIILLTAKNTLQAKIEGLESGADAYIEKPFSLDHLLIQISTLLANRDKIKNYFASSPLVHIKSMAYNKADELFLEKLNDAIYKNIDNKLMDVDLLADLMNMSRPTLYRKIKAISNLSPNELINITRLKKAAELLVESDFKIQKIALMTGFNSQAQFGRSFVKQFGVTPSEYARSKQFVK